MTPATPTSSQPDSRQAVLRLLVTLALMAVGASGMFVVPVVLPAVQAEFGVARADASLPYTALMIGFGVGGLLMGRLADRRGAIWPPIVQHFIETVGWRQTYVAWVVLRLEHGGLGAADAGAAPDAAGDCAAG